MKRHLVLAVLLATATHAAALDRSAEIERAIENMAAAQKALEEAKQRRERGTEPLPGERIGTAKSTSRLDPQYFERQRTLEHEVALAQWRYEQTLERWNAVR